MKTVVKQEHWVIPEEYRNQLTDTKLIEFYYQEAQERLRYEVELSKSLSKTVFSMLGILITAVTIIITFTINSADVVTSRYLMFLLLFYMILIAVGFAFLLPKVTRVNGRNPKNVFRKEIFDFLKSKKEEICYNSILLYYVEATANDIDTQVIRNKKASKIYTGIVVAIIVSIAVSMTVFALRYFSIF
jgi:type III secretory pathway lipoprotein EscJ